MWQELKNYSGFGFKNKKEAVVRATAPLSCICQLSLVADKYESIVRI